MCNAAAPLALSTYTGTKIVPGTASTLKNGDLVQFGTDTKVAVEVCLGMLTAFLQRSLCLRFAHYCCGNIRERRSLACEVSAVLAASSSLD